MKSASETATAAGLTALVAALTKSGLAATVDGLKDVTIFAPTNEAFAKVASTTSGLGKEALGDILKYHIVKKVIKSTDLKTGDKVPTLYGPIITVTLAEKKVLINKATVVKADVPFKGGIVHVIDAYVYSLIITTLVANHSSSVLTPPPKN